jgi:hypothetical protein
MADIHHRLTELVNREYTVAAATTYGQAHVAAPA